MMHATLTLYKLNPGETELRFSPPKKFMGVAYGGVRVNAVKVDSTLLQLNAAPDDADMPSAGHFAFFDFQAMELRRCWLEGAGIDPESEEAKRYVTAVTR